MVKRFLLRLSPEWTVAILLFLVAFMFSRLLQAPFQFPAAGSLLFIGFTYLLPFVLISIWMLLPLPFLIYRGELKKTVVRVIQQAAAALCLAIVMLLHFHIKLWAPLINPASYDPLYEAIDRTCFFWMDPLINWRGQWHLEWVDHLYFNVFMLMFLCSFIVHDLRSRREFRRVFLASLLVQAFGAVGYLIAPAIGPFIYHQGANDHVTIVQASLLAIRHDLVAGGIAWLQAHTGEDIAAGLAAMPSLHVAASFVFLYYARKYCHWLAWLYWPCFLWIVFAAMATRWHYGIDLIVGYGLAHGCILLSNAWMKAHEAAVKETTVPLPLDPIRHPELVEGSASGKPVPSE